MADNTKTNGLLDLLEARGFDLRSPFKLVRHREPSKGYEMEHFRAQGWLEWYQAFQAKPIFKSLKYIVSFVGVGGTQARLYGVYEVLSCVPSEEGPDLPEALRRRVLPEHWKAPGGYYYRLRRIRGYEDLEDRLVIEWGKGARSWHQRPRNKEVIAQ